MISSYFIFSLVYGVYSHFPFNSGPTGASVSAQSLIDYLTDSVMNNLVKKMDISNVQLNDQSKVPSSALAYAMQREVDKLNTQSDNLMMKITSGSMTETIGSLPAGKYSGYYSSGATAHSLQLWHL